MAGITRPTGEQLRFASQFTGDHVLDTYLEAAERGGRRLDDLLSDLFDENGVFRQSNFQFRYNPATNDLEYRIGQFVDPDASWNKITPLLQDAGTFSSSTQYENLQLVTDSVDDVYCVHGLSAPQTFASEAVFRASANTTRLVNVSRAREWAIKVDGPVDGSDYSAKYNANLAAASASAASTSESNALAYRNTAQSHKDDAQAAQTASEAARDLSQSYRDTAQSHSTAAQSAQSAAEAAQAAAEAAQQGAEDVFDSFDDRYLGSKTADPTLDNDGDALKPGALYWNSVSAHLKFYNGSNWDVFGTGTMSVQSADNVAITGGTITGITDLALEDGGTGASLSAPAADRVLFYDHSATSTSWLALSSALAITGTTLGVVPANIDHDALQNHSADQHVAHSNVNINAGSGLTGGGNISASRTLNIGQGTGITVAASSISTNDSEIDHDALQNFSANRHIDHTAVSITAGSGLTGGGSIAAPRTLNIGQGNGITVAADAISVNPAQVDHDALQNFSSDEHVAHTAVSITAGAGLTGGGNIAATRTLNVGAGTGIVVNANDIAVSTNLSALHSNPLTSDELQQLQNINTSTISATQWGYLGAANQNVHTTANVTFGQVTPTNGINALARLFDAGASPNINIDNINASPSSHSLTFRSGATNTDRRFGIYTDYASGNFHLRTYNTSTGNFVGNPLTIAANAPSILSLNADGSAAFAGTLSASAIDGTPIGGTTPAAGAFTTLETDSHITTGGHLYFGSADLSLRQISGELHVYVAGSVVSEFESDRIRLHPTVAFSAGSAAAPPISFGVDPDTGIYRATTNQLGIVTAGVERMRIDSSGNVGISTTNPSVKAHIYANDASQTDMLRIEQDGTGDAAMRYSLTGVANWVTGIDNSVSDNFIIGSGTLLSSNPVLTLTSAGNVGLGTSNPARPLDVAGAARILDGAPLEWGGVSTYVTGTSNNLLFATNSVERMRIDSSGSVGIGLTNPGYKLDVGGDIRAYSSGSTANIYARTQSGTGHVRFYAVNDGRAFFLNEAAGATTGFRYRNSLGTPFSAFAFDEGGTTFYDDAGAAGVVWKADTKRFGIGTTNPQYGAHVAGTFGFAPGASVTPVNNGDVVFEATSNTTLTVKLKGSDGTVRSGAIALS